MSLNYPEVLSLEQKGVEFTYSEKDTILYALGIGIGDRPECLDELKFVYEKSLSAVPTLATVVAWGAGVSTEQLGVNYQKVLHGEEETIFHSPMPASAHLVADSAVVEVFDKGEDKGALVIRQTNLTNAATGTLLATINRTIFARGDGGCGGANTAPPKPHPLPERLPDAQIEYSTSFNQALLYRLCGDKNPLHVDYDVAKSVGFDRPILHGLCTYGITCRAVMEVFLGFDPAPIASHAARFSAPVLPGETLLIELWKDGLEVSFQAKAKERDVIVIKNGRTVLNA